MIATPRLSLPLLAAGQAQKHVTHNDALVRLDGLIHLGVASRSQATPPSVPIETSAYLVPQDGSGAFDGHANELALFEDGGWTFLTPRAGWQCWIADEAELHVWTGTQWRRASPESAFGAERWGVSAAADETTRFVVSAEASLFNHAGSGHQLKLNKAGPAQTASLLFQDGYSGRVEMGLAGDDDLHLKVSAEGASWTEAMVVNRTTGAVSLPATPWAQAQNLLVNGDMQINRRGFGGGALAAGAYGFDRWKAGTSGASISRSGYTISLSAGELQQPVEPGFWGLASFAGVPLTLSVENLSGGALSVTAGSASGTIAAGTGRRSVTLTPSSGDSESLSIGLAPAAGAVSFARVKLELGTAATAVCARPRTLEELLCARYHWSCEGTVTLDAYQAAGATVREFFALPVPMRTVPTVSFTVSSTSNVAAASAALVALSASGAQATVTAAALGRVQASFSAIAFDAEL